MSYWAGGPLLPCTRRGARTYCYYLLCDKLTFGFIFTFLGSGGVGPAKTQKVLEYIFGGESAQNPQQTEGWQSAPEMGGQAENRSPGSGVKSKFSSTAIAGYSSFLLC